MGGCASKPNDLDICPESLPSEAPATPKKAEGEGEIVVAQENVKEGGDESKKEDPLVDLSEPKKEAGTGGDSSSESKPADAQVVSDGESHSDLTTANPSEKTVDEPSKDKVEAAKEEITESAKEVEQAAEPSIKDKSDAPLVTV